MAQSLSRILLHIVFSTKQRRPDLTDDLRFDLHAYLAAACRAQGGEAFRVGGTDNHVHIACLLSRTVATSDLLRSVKAGSSLWVKERGSRHRLFAWQAGYGAFSIGQSQLQQVVEYIGNQEEHHRTRSFEEEFVGLLRLYEADYEEQYLWD